MRFNKLLICDDHPPIRSAVTYIARELFGDIVVLEAGNGNEALTLLEREQGVDLVLLDLHMPGMNGFDLLPELKNRYPSVPVVVLSSDESRATVIDALERGAAGYICKSSPTDLLAKFLEHALKGNIVLPTAIAAEEPVSITHPADQKTAALGLSPRQTEVLNCMLRGMSNKQICRELDLAEGTVKNHAVSIFRALNVNNRAQAVIEAGRRGLPIGSTHQPGDTQSI